MPGETLRREVGAEFVAPATPLHALRAGYPRALREALELMLGEEGGALAAAAGRIVNLRSGEFGEPGCVHLQECPQAYGEQAEHSVAELAALERCFPVALAACTGDEPHLGEVRNWLMAKAPQPTTRLRSLGELTDLCEELRALQEVVGGESREGLRNLDLRLSAQVRAEREASRIDPDDTASVRIAGVLQREIEENLGRLVGSWSREEFCWVIEEVIEAPYGLGGILTNTKRQNQMRAQGLLPSAVAETPSQPRVWVGFMPQRTSGVSLMGLAALWAPARWRHRHEGLLIALDADIAALLQHYTVCAIAPSPEGDTSPELTLECLVGAWEAEPPWVQGAGGGDAQAVNERANALLSEAIACARACVDPGATVAG